MVASIGFPGSLWLVDSSHGSWMRLTGGEEDTDPRFRDDGQAVLYGGGLPGRRCLFRVSLDGGARVAVMWAPQPGAGEWPPGMFLDDWSRDGRAALYHPGLGGSLWSAPVTNDGEPRRVVECTGCRTDQARFSPDGRWIAFHSDETNRAEVYVVPFSPTGERWQISTRGGVQPLWRRDGRELFYLDRDGNLMSVEVHTERTFAAGTPRLLFRTALGFPDFSVEDYGVTADGQRFLFKMPVAAGVDYTLKLVLDWPALVKQ
ncbi:MAG: hypothetical protein AB1714_04265 [Acidobacteriota bacterium]